MQQKEYLIAGKIFYLKEYGELTGFEEEKINSILFTEKKEDVFNINLSGYDLFPVILIPEDKTDDIHNIEWKNVRIKQAAEIIVDFIVEKKTSQDSMLVYMKELTEQKLQQFQNMKENTVTADSSGVKTL